MRFVLICLLFPAFVYALPDTSPVPGGIITLPISNTTERPSVLFKKRNVMVIKNETKWIAVIGLPLNIKQGTHKALVRIKGKKPYSIPFQVNNKKYPEQHITIKNKRMVNPNKYDMKRISADRSRINKALKHWSDNDDVQLNFNKPVEGIYSSAFGLKRFFNKQARRPHSGLDIAAKQGTLILAPAKGTIVETGNYFFNGHTVFIDHGQGLISMYCHLDEINVKNNQPVSQNDVIGKIGMTGRVTGPHLHWSVSLNNNRVDPSLFLPQSQRP